MDKIIALILWHEDIPNPAFVLLMMSSCAKKRSIEGFESELWINDKYGCEGKRLYLSNILLDNWTNLKGMDDDDVVELLGKPEGSDWETRGKKTYFYYIQKGSQCDSTLVLNGAKIAVEFDALGTVKLVTERKF